MKNTSTPDLGREYTSHKRPFEPLSIAVLVSGIAVLVKHLYKNTSGFSVWKLPLQPTAMWPHTQNSLACLQGLKYGHLWGFIHAREISHFVNSSASSDVKCYYSFSHTADKCAKHLLGTRSLKMNDPVTVLGTLGPCVILHSNLFGRICLMQWKSTGQLECLHLDWPGCRNSRHL